MTGRMLHVLNVLYRWTAPIARHPAPPGRTQYSTQHPGPSVASGCLPSPVPSPLPLLSDNKSDS